jgi:hypothetical protein
MRNGDSGYPPSSAMFNIEELEKVRVVGTRIYHASFEPPKGLVRSTR